MTMPTFEPVAFFHRWAPLGIRVIKDQPPCTKLFTESQLQQAYEAGKREAVPAWLPIETAQKSLNSTLLLGNGKLADGYWGEQCNKGKGAWVWPYVRTEPTHWMPLPAAPKGEKG